MPDGMPVASKDAPVGGQAVLEGVMMRGVSTWAVAVRKPPRGRAGGRARRDRGHLRAAGLVGEAPPGPAPAGDPRRGRARRVAEDRLPRAGDLGQRPARPRRSGEEPEPIGGFTWGLTIAFSLVLAIGLFFVVPVGATSLIKDQLGSALLFWLVEGVLRTAIFIGYIVAISRLPDLRRVFEYHGAEHKTISCFEAGDRLVPERAELYSRLHPRCGTSFLLIVMVLAIFVFAPIGLPAWYWLVLSRILGIPLIAGLSYEVIKWAGKHRRKAWVRAADVARADAPEPHHPRARPRRSSRSRSPRSRPCSRSRTPRGRPRGGRDRDRRLAAPAATRASRDVRRAFDTLWRPASRRVSR